MEEKDKQSRLDKIKKKWKEDNKNTKLEPEVVYLETLDDFDSIKHQNKFIEFPPGGEVGDIIWKLQYMHNASVILEFNSMNCAPDCVPETFILLDKEELLDIKEIITIYDDILINSYSFATLNIYKMLYSNKKKYVTPVTYNKEYQRAHKDTLDHMYFMEFFNCNSDVEVFIVYNDDTRKKITDAIQELKYEIID